MKETSLHPAGMSRNYEQKVVNWIKVVICVYIHTDRADIRSACGFTYTRFRKVIQYRYMGLALSEFCVPVSNNCSTDPNICYRLPLGQLFVCSSSFGNYVKSETLVL